MGSGGARSRSGPAPDPNALRRETHKASGGVGEGDWLILPPEGRKGRPPAWPLTQASARERAIWNRLWKKPQAVAWEMLMIDDQVAFYCRRLAVAEQGEVNASAANSVKSMMADLGLTAPGMRGNRWRIAKKGEAAAEPTPAPAKGARRTTSSSARNRFTVVR